MTEDGEGGEDFDASGGCWAMPAVRTRPLTATAIQRILESML